MGGLLSRAPDSLGERWGRKIIRLLAVFGDSRRRQNHRKGLILKGNKLAAGYR
jgi:hypothetical protein